MADCLETLDQSSADAWIELEATVFPCWVTIRKLVLRLQLARSMLLLGSTKYLSICSPYDLNMFV